MHPHLARFGPVVLPTYAVLAAIGLVAAIALAGRAARHRGLNDTDVIDLCLWTAAGTMLLSRIILIAQTPMSFLHYPLFILALPTVTRFGLLVAAATALAYMLWKRMPVRLTLDAVAPAAALFAGFLHVGSIFAGDDLGTATPLAIGRIIPGDEGHHPVSLYAAVAAFGIAAVAWIFLRSRPRAGEVFGFALASLAAARFVVDEFRPEYLLPQTYLPALVLRVDQAVLLLTVVCGALFFASWGNRHAK